MNAEHPNPPRVPTPATRQRLSTGWEDRLAVDCLGISVVIVAIVIWRFGISSQEVMPRCVQIDGSGVGCGGDTTMPVAVIALSFGLPAAGLIWREN